MKSVFILLAVLSLGLTSCKKYKAKEVYANVPVYMEYEDLRTSFSFETDVALSGAGNIFVHDQYILISEVDRGIHIFDNSNPYNPTQIGFMNIPGNTQIAVKGDIMYANSYIDLIAVDINNIHDPKEIFRVEDAFHYSTPASNDKYPVADVYTDRGVVVAWKVEKTNEVSGFMKKYFVADCDECEQTVVQTKSSVSTPVNLGGSESQFAIIGDNLYALDQNQIMTFDISNRETPSFSSRSKTYVETETLFPSDDHLFVGTTTGMLIYATENPEAPNKVSEIEHVRSCDPVIVHGNYAYLTLRSTGDCGGDINEFQVIDVTNKKSPKHKESYDLTDPNGLGADNNLLFICDGQDGLKIYDLTIPEESGDNLLHHFPNVKATDVILNNGVAILVTEFSLQQYNYSTPSSIQYISSIDF